MASGLLSATWTSENFYETTLSADITNSALDVFLTTVPTNSEGTLVIDPDSSTNREIIYYSSKTGTKVTCPANGRGYDSSTATSHTSGTKVIMAPIADWFTSLKTLFTTTPGGYTSVGYTPNTVTALGNRSYSCVFNSVDLTSVLSNGMRLKLTRTVTAPTQCTSLNGTTQYYSKSSPAGMTFTNNFVISGWMKLSSYAVGSMLSRYNGTSGFDLAVLSDGRLQLAGYNAGAANYCQLNSYQSLPLNKWVHIAVEMDMTVTTNTATTNYVMIDGVDAPAVVTRGGTNPTALVQAGNLEIGGRNGGLQPFAGKIAQVAIYNAKVTQATILASMHQTLSGSETSLISAYSFNGIKTDLNANANNLTANGSAVETNADSPFGIQADGTTAGTTEYAIITKTAFSTNTTLTVQVPEGNAIPTSGGVSAVSYSTQKVPYGFPAQRGKWKISSISKVQGSQVTAVATTWYNLASHSINLPIGEFEVSYQGSPVITASTASIHFLTLSTANNSQSDPEWTTQNYFGAAATVGGAVARSRSLSVAAATNYYLNHKQEGGSSVTIYTHDGTTGPQILEAELAYL